jgi:hypothetical protein
VICSKAEAEAAMEKLAAGFEKQKVVCVTNSFKEEGKRQKAENSGCSL